MSTGAPTPHPTHDQLVAAGVGLIQEERAGEVMAALAVAEVRSILLKGPGVIRWLYPELTDRVSVDIDLLVAPGDVGRATEVLASLGYRSREPLRHDRHAWSFERPNDDVPIDLHQTIVGVGVTNEDAWKLLSGGAQTQRVGRHQVEVLSAGARALHVALHAAQEIPDKTKALRDLEQAIDVLPPSLWDEALVVARSGRAEAAFAAGLQLSERGREISTRLQLSGELTPEVALRLTDPPPLSLGLNTLVDLHGRRRISYGLARAFPRPAAMRARSALARRGSVGLVVAYAQRVGWIALRAAPALGAVIAARRKSRASRPS